MDKIDIQILAELQADGRLSNRDLAERVSLSPSPCWRRVRQLESDGVIRRYAALLDPASMGLNVLAFAHVSLENHHADSIEQFDAAIEQWPNVLECHATSGDYDFMLKIVAADMADYDQFLSQSLLQIPAVRTVNTSFSLRSRKLTTSLPIDVRAHDNKEKA